MPSLANFFSHCLVFPSLNLPPNNSKNDRIKAYCFKKRKPYCSLPFFLGETTVNAEPVISMGINIQYVFIFLEPPCTHEMENIPTILVSGVPKPAPNLFIPECDEDGFFMPQQCHKKDCWCVDRNGGEIKGTRVKGSQTKCGT